MVAVCGVGWGGVGWQHCVLVVYVVKVSAVRGGLVDILIVLCDQCVVCDLHFVLISGVCACVVHLHS